MFHKGLFLIFVLLFLNCDKNSMIPNDLVRQDSELEIEWITIDSGLSFTMGDNLYWDFHHYDNQPAHRVTLDPYQIGKYEVTNSQYIDFLNKAYSIGMLLTPNNRFVCAVDSQIYLLFHLSGRKSYIRFEKNVFVVEPEKENYPVRGVTWYGANVMAHFYGWRLPTEAEWERTAKGSGSPKIWPWGNTDPTCEHLNCYLRDHHCVGDVIEVGTHELGRSKDGCFDLAGNLAEWCSDYYGNYSETHQNNPTGPATGEYRVVRGGSWCHDPEFCSTVWRDMVEPEYNYSSSYQISTYIGFRLVRSK
jgi:formylglycine-generating enzyme